jgi:uncharacterized delta-60 repeat protein
MTASVKVSGVYKDAAPLARIGGAWKVCKEAWLKNNGSWKQFFLAGGVTDQLFLTDTTYLDSFWANIATGIAPGPSLTVYDLAVQPDGKIIIVGEFSTFSFYSAKYVIRLNSNGTIDEQFLQNLGTSDFNRGASALVKTVSLQPDGKILLGGVFTTFGNTSTGRFIRLNENGTVDTAFMSNVGSGASGTVNKIAVQSDGKIVLAGDFTTFNGVAANCIVRLNSNGTRDTGFVPAEISSSITRVSVTAMAIQADGNICYSAGVRFLVNDPQFPYFSVKYGVFRMTANGGVDSAFNNNTGSTTSSASNIDQQGLDIAIQSDGKILLGGDFVRFNTTVVNRIIRLNTDGTRDTSFTSNTGTALNSSVSTIHIESDGEILVGGSFTLFNGLSAKSIVKLNPNGTVNTEFLDNIKSGANNEVKTIKTQAGKILIGGSFDRFSGAAVRYVARLKFDGFLEPVPGFNNTASVVAVQPDNKIVVGGLFTNFNGTTANGIARLNPDGSIDSVFTNNIGSGPLGNSSTDFVNAIAVQSDGKILIGGSFSFFNGRAVKSFVRLNSNGTIDTAFMDSLGPGAAGNISAIAVQSDGKIILGGNFTNFNSSNAKRVVRINVNGTVDTSFTTNNNNGADGDINVIAIQGDGKIILGGFFNTFGGVTVNRIVRLNSDGTIDTAFSSNTSAGPNGGVVAIALQTDGKIILGGFFTSFNTASAKYIVRLNSNGTTDTDFSINNGTGFNNTVRALAIQSNGKIIVGGEFGMYHFYSAPNLARLNTNGKMDVEYVANFLPDGTGGGIGYGENSTEFYVYDLALQSDDKAIIIGAFTTFDHVKRNRIARIGSDFAI